MVAPALLAGGVDSAQAILQIVGLVVAVVLEGAMEFLYVTAVDT
jgi:hypothetical protein